MERPSPTEGEHHQGSVTFSSISDIEFEGPDGISNKQ